MNGADQGKEIRPGLRHNTMTKGSGNAKWTIGNCLEDSPNINTLIDASTCNNLLIDNYVNSN